MSSLRFGGSCKVPTEIAACPECGGELFAQVFEWDEETGMPTELGVDVSCIDNDVALDEWEQDQGLGDEDWRGFNEVSHRYRQSDWQSINNCVRSWIRWYIRSQESPVT